MELYLSHRGTFCLQEIQTIIDKLHRNNLAVSAISIDFKISFISLSDNNVLNLYSIALENLLYLLLLKLIIKEILLVVIFKNYKNIFMKKNLMLFFVLVIVTSCSTANRVVSPREINNPLNVEATEAVRTIIPVVADLEVSQDRISVNKIFPKIESMDIAKNEVLRLALIIHKADFLLDPTFESTVIKNKTEITVTGWPVYYKSIKQIEQKDSKALKRMPINLQKATAEEYLPLEKKKKVGLWFAVGATILGTIIALGAD
jgi:hypothetical protein